MAKITMRRGKFGGINAVANQNGMIVALAIDPRGSLKKAIGKAKGSEASDGEVIEFKSLVAEVLTPYTVGFSWTPYTAARRAPTGRKPAVCC
jgi:tagatose 1,6-diphosphate aldolase